MVGMVLGAALHQFWNKNGSCDRSFFLYCDAHPIVKDYQERKKMWGFGSMHQLLIRF